MSVHYYTYNQQWLTIGADDQGIADALIRNYSHAEQPFGVKRILTELVRRYGGV